MATEKRAPTKVYSAVMAWKRTREDVRRQVSPQQESDYLRIARLPAVWGEALDAHGATYRMVRWVAGPADVMVSPVRERRYRALLSLLERGGRNRDFEGLVKAESVIAPFTREEAARPPAKKKKRRASR